MDKPAGNIQKDPETPSPSPPPAATDCLTLAQAALKAQADALRRSLEDKRSLSWIQFATD